MAKSASDAPLADQIHVLSPFHRRSRRPQNGVAVGPSSGVLSLLVTITAASSTADGSPLIAQPTPPPFLCPYIARSTHEGRSGLPADSIAGTSASAALLAAAPTHHHRKRGTVADKFVKDVDGKWRKVDRYTLYGSTVCTDCSSTTAPDADDFTQPSSISNATQSKDEFDTTMPNGWNSKDPVNTSRARIILSTSVILACFICFFMIATIIWRRKKRRHRKNDVELRLRKRRGDDVFERQDIMEKDARVKQKLWARASARWQAAVRSSARRRRNRRLVAGARNVTTSTPSSHSSSLSLASPLALSSSRPSSPQPSTLSNPETRISPSLHPSATQITDHTTPSLRAPKTSSPPAYIHPMPDLPKLGTSHESSGMEDGLPDPFAQPPHHDDPLLYDDSYHAAHVATDDKALLAQMAHMVSGPPVATRNESFELVISAPDWHDEVLEGVDDARDLPGSSVLRELPPSVPSSCLFPPPPSKHNMAAGEFYDYPNSFEPLDPDAEWSVPPFEEYGGSAPPLEDAEMVPSAPPLSDVPDWEDANGQGHDRDRDLSHQHLQPSCSTSVPAASVSPLPSYYV